MNDHAVYFYEEDTFLIENVATFARKGLEQGGTVIIVATPAHLTDLKAKLKLDNVGGLTSDHDHYVTLDASETLELFMVNDWPNENLFLKVLGQIIGSAVHAPVHIYGEMVALLWAEGRQKAAIRLEQLWNQLASQQDFSLLCGYPVKAFEGPTMAKALRDVCACHSHSIGGPADART